jgi:hypothetical protein
MTPCVLLNKYQCFGTALSLLQSPVLPFPPWIQVLFFENSCFCTPLLMEAAQSPVMLVPIHKSQLRHLPEDWILHHYRCENLKSHTPLPVWSHTTKIKRIWYTVGHNWTTKSGTEVRSTDICERILKTVIITNKWITIIIAINFN